MSSPPDSVEYLIMELYGWAWHDAFGLDETKDAIGEVLDVHRVRREEFESFFEQQMEYYRDTDDGYGPVSWRDYRSHVQDAFDREFDRERLYWEIKGKIMAEDTTGDEWVLEQDDISAQDRDYVQIAIRSDIAADIVGWLDMVAEHERIIGHTDTAQTANRVAVLVEERLDAQENEDRVSIIASHDDIRLVAKYVGLYSSYANVAEETDESRFSKETSELIYHEIGEL